jgi:hypothetical protein
VIPARRAGAAIAVLSAVLAVAACGNSQRKALVPFPGLGYRYVAPRLPAGLPAGAVLVVDMTNAGSVRPASLQFASDATLSRLRWTAWGGALATGQGTATVRICTPSCGGGHNASYPATVSLQGIKVCSGRRFYERATVTLTTAKGSRSSGAYIHAPCQQA